MRYRNDNKLQVFKRNKFNNSNKAGVYLLENNNSNQIKMTIYDKTNPQTINNGEDDIFLSLLYTNPIEHLNESVFYCKIKYIDTNNDDYICSFKKEKICNTAVHGVINNDYKRCVFTYKNQLSKSIFTYEYNAIQKTIDLDIYNLICMYEDFVC